MFACSMYPADPDTLANVEMEVTHQVKKANYLYLSLFIVVCKCCCCMLYCMKLKDIMFRYEDCSIMQV